MKFKMPDEQLCWKIMEVVWCKYKPNYPTERYISADGSRNQFRFQFLTSSGFSSHLEASQWSEIPLNTILPLWVNWDMSAAQKVNWMVIWRLFVSPKESPLCLKQLMSKGCLDATVPNFGPFVWVSCGHARIGADCQVGDEKGGIKRFHECKFIWARCKPSLGQV